MSKVTSKYQVTLPRHIARAHRIEPGAEIEFESAGEVIRIHAGSKLRPSPPSIREALRSFDEATQRQKARQGAALERLGTEADRHDRGWTRDELYAERIGS